MCPVGTYSTSTATASCTACPATTTTAATGATALSQCLCAPGFTGPNAGPCTACSAGQVKLVAGSQPCADCAYACDPNLSGSCTTSACPTTCNSGFRASGSTAPVYCYPIQSTLVASVDSTNPTNVNSGQYFYLGYGSSGAATVFPYMTFDFKTSNLCLTSLTLFISDYLVTTTCGSGLIHTMNLVDPSTWTPASLTWNSRPSIWSGAQSITWPQQSLLQVSKYVVGPSHALCPGSVLARARTFSSPPRIPPPPRVLSRAHDAPVGSRTRCRTASRAFRCSTAPSINSAARYGVAVPSSARTQSPAVCAASMPTRMADQTTRGGGRPFS